MPIGEDVPMLIPISIVLTVFVLFFIFLFINFSERNEIIRMSEAAMDISDLSANIIFSDSLGRIDEDKLGSSGHCKELSDINITPNYHTKINISKSTGEYWCWDNTNYYSDKPKSVVTKAIPILIEDNYTITAGKLVVSIGK